MVNLDVPSVAKEISYYGETVSVTTITDSAYSKWGDPTESTSSANKTAFVQIINQDDEMVKEGIFQSGDKIFYFKGDETGISRGNRITHDSKAYEIFELIEH